RSDVGRGGGTAVVTALMLLPLMLMVAFAVDLCNVWRTDAELQNAADAAALAGATQLVVPNQTLQPLEDVVNGVVGGVPILGGLLGGLVGGVEDILNGILSARQRQDATDNAVRTAQAYAGMHQAGGAPVVLAAKDVEVGYVADPSAAPDSPAGQFQSNPVQFPNSVRVTVRQDVPLFFGALFGVRVSSRKTSAVATLNGRGITGFNGAGSTLLPLTIDLDTYNWLRGLASAPPGGAAGDVYAVRSAIQSGQTTGNLAKGVGDGTPEGQLSQNTVTPGNLGLVSLKNSQTNTVPPYDNWVRNGPSGADLGSFGPQGLQATPVLPTVMFGGPALNPALDPAFKSIVGQPRTMLVYRTTNLLGLIRLYTVVGFVGVTVVDVNLNRP